MQVDEWWSLSRLHVSDAKPISLDKPFFKHYLPLEYISSLKENTDILGHQNILVEDDLTSGDLPRAGDAAQDITPRPNIEILLGLRPAAVDHEIRVHPDLARRVTGFHLDIGDQVARTRRWVLRPGHAGIQPRDALAQSLLGFVEDRQLVFLGQIIFDVAVGVEDRDRLARLRIAVASTAHPVADVVGQQLQPFVKAPLVEQPGFSVEELLDL